MESLSGYLLLAIKLIEDPIKYATAYNFGPLAPDILTVKEVVELAIAKWGNGNYKIEQDANAKHEANLLMLDITKATNELSWHPKLNSKEAIGLTIDWYKKIDDSKNGISLTQDQIKDFFKN